MRRAAALGLTDPALITLYLATFVAKYPAPEYDVLQVLARNGNTHK